MSKIQWHPQSVRVARSAKSIFTTQAMPPVFFLNMILLCLPCPLIIPLAFNSKVYCPSKHESPPTSTHDHANTHRLTESTNLLFHSSQIYHQVFGHFLSSSCTPHIAFAMDLSVLHKIPISLSFRRHALLPYKSYGLA